MLLAEIETLKWLQTQIVVITLGVSNNSWTYSSKNLDTILPIVAAYVVKY
jgi:hypothetical protein